jgi:hypothetical protein
MAFYNASFDEKAIIATSVLNHNDEKKYRSFEPGENEQHVIYADWGLSRDGRFTYAIQAQKAVGIQFWDTRTRKKLHFVETSYPAAPFSSHFSANGQRMVFVGNFFSDLGSQSINSYALAVIDLDQQFAIRKNILKHNEWTLIRDIGINHDGSLVLFSGKQYGGYHSGIYSWNPATNEILNIKIPGDRVQVSADGKKAVIFGSENGIRENNGLLSIYDIDQKQVVSTTKVSESLTDVGINFNGTALVISTSHGKKLQIWNEEPE